MTTFLLHISALALLIVIYVLYRLVSLFEHRSFDTSSAALLFDTLIM
jgi:hypothetical protein